MVLSYSISPSYSTVFRYCSFKNWGGKNTCLRYPIFQVLFFKKKRKEKRKIHSSQIFKSVDRSLFSRIPNTEKSRIQKLRFIRFSIVFLATKQKMSNSEDDFESKTEPRIRDIRISSCRRRKTFSPFFKPLTMKYRNHRSTAHRQIKQRVEFGSTGFFIFYPFLYIFSYFFFLNRFFS